MYRSRVRNRWLSTYTHLIDTNSYPGLYSQYASKIWRRDWRPGISPRQRHAASVFFIVVCIRAFELWWGVWGSRKARRSVIRLRQPCTSHHPIRLASAVVINKTITGGRHYDHSNLCRNSFPDYP